MFSETYKNNGRVSFTFFLVKTGQDVGVVWLYFDGE